MTKPLRSLLLFAAFIPALHAATPASNSSDTTAVLAPVQALFRGMAARDAAAIEAPLLPGGSLTLMREGKPIQMTFAAFAQRVAQPGTTPAVERIHHPLVRIDHDLAVVWAPFDLTVDGKLDHCGTDLFSLVRRNGQWLIASIADTGRKTCPAR